MKRKILISTQDKLEGKTISECFGLVQGNTVRSPSVGAGFSLKYITGGEVKGFTKVVQDARQEAIDRMLDEAESLGADAVVGFRMITAEVLQSCSEIVAYGTAVKLTEPTD